MAMGFRLGGWFQALLDGQRSRPWLWPSVALLSLLGYLANHLPLAMTFGVDFIFGSIFTLMAAALAGPRAGVASALVASSYTLILWNHPYAIAIFTAEALWVGLFLRRGNGSILLATSLYWVLLGMPLVLAFYGGVLHQEGASLAVIVLKQALNGIFNALVADLVLTLVPLERWLTHPGEPRRVSFSHILFHQTVLFLMLPTLVLIRVTNQREEKRAFEDLATNLRSQVGQTEKHLSQWVSFQVRVAQALADLGTQYALRPSARLQEEVARIHQLSPDFHNVFLGDAYARSVAFDPPVNERGASTIGLDFSDRVWFKALQQTLKPVVSDVFMGRGGVFRPIFSISVPIVGPDGLVCFGLGAVDLEKLQTQLSYSEDPNLATTILDAGGKVVTSTLPGRKPMEPVAQPPLKRSQAITSEVFLNFPEVGASKSVMEAWKGAFFSIRRPIAGTGWTLLTEYPLAPLRDYFYQSTIRSLAWMAGWYLVALGLATLVTRFVARTPARLVALSQDLVARVEAGEPIEWPGSQILEMSHLITNFRAMTEALARRIQEIHQEVAKNAEHERALIHQSRLAAMGEMVGNIAHQWRQPLNALAMILANLQDARRHDQLTDEYLAASLKQGNALVQKMSTTITDFIDFFRPNKAPTAFSMQQQVKEALKLVAPTLTHHGVVVDLQDGPEAWVLGHPNEFSQVLLNLLTNAREAIQNARVAEGRIKIEITREIGFARLSVSDNGGGIGAVPIERIFEPYFSDKATGTGLGLYMSRMLIEQSMGGSLEVRNLPDGAELTITIPLAETTDAFPRS